MWNVCEIVNKIFFFLNNNLELNFKLNTEINDFPWMLKMQKSTDIYNNFIVGRMCCIQDMQIGREWVRCSGRDRCFYAIRLQKFRLHCQQIIGHSIRQWNFAPLKCTAKNNNKHRFMWTIFTSASHVYVNELLLTRSPIESKAINWMIRKVTSITRRVFSCK